LIRRLNREVAGTLRSWGRDALYESPFDTFDLDIILTPGQVVQLGSARTVKALHTPGHTKDFVSYWLSEESILVASEAVGCDDGHGYIMTDPCESSQNLTYRSSAPDTSSLQQALT
jgi:glyoxylase-like metal-dependent hydrolase (beta-lactamase superfamily II)